jgi:hypothetical protein
MPRYSKRPMPVGMLLGKKRGYKKQDTAKIDKNANGANGLPEGTRAPECAHLRTRVRGQAHQGASKLPAGGKFAQGPVRLDQVSRIARLGAAPLLVWLAVRAHADFRNGNRATVKWIADETGWSRRTVQDAVAKLEASGSLRRFGEELEVPDYAR